METDMFDLPLFPSESQIVRAVLGPERAKNWSTVGKVLEKRGFPQVDPLHGGRYWPAIEAWYRSHYGATLPGERPYGYAGVIVRDTAPDGKENFDAILSPRKRPKR